MNQCEWPLRKAYKRLTKNNDIICYLILFDKTILDYNNAKRKQTEMKSYTSVLDLNDASSSS